VFERRLPQLDDRRAAMLAEAKEQGRVNLPAALLEIIFRPIAEIVDSAKRHTYAAFLLGLYELERDEQVRIRSDDLAPVTSRIVELLRQALGDLPLPLLGQRLLSATMMFLDLLVRLDEKKIRSKEEETIREGLAVATAMMTAPRDSRHAI
jgi:hypothetical protein